MPRYQVKTVVHCFSLIFVVVLSCTNSTGSSSSVAKASDATVNPATSKPSNSRHFSGAILNGMKGDSIFFDLSPDGKKLEQLTFKGYWRCNGRLEQITAGPQGSFIIENGKINGHITEPPDGGSTAWRFELEADIKGNIAIGNFRMNINNPGCDTYKLQWKASPK